MDKSLPADDKKCIIEVVKNQIINFNSVDTIYYSRLANWFSCDNRVLDFSFDRVEQRKHDGYTSSRCEHRSLPKKGSTYQLDCVVRSIHHFLFSPQINELYMFKMPNGKRLSEWYKENHISLWYEMFTSLEGRFAACRIVNLYL